MALRGHGLVFESSWQALRRDKPMQQDKLEGASVRAPLSQQQPKIACTKLNSYVA